MRSEYTPVLIVGAGPVGLTSALLLAARGISCRIVDRRDGPHRAPQAHVVNPRTLEICRNLGLDMTELTRLSTPREDGSTVRWMTTLGGEEIGALPYERQGAENLEFTPTPLLNLPQHLFEPVLLKAAQGKGSIEISYGCEWESLDQDDTGVTSRLRDLGSGEVHEVRSRWVLGADGAGSRVRKSLGIEMHGPQSLQSFVMIHFESNLRWLVGERPAILYWICDPRCLGSFVAHDIDRTWVFMHPYDPEREEAAAYDETRCREVVRRALGRDDADFRIRDISTWTMTAQIAERYRQGRVFLIGDSAHRFPPSGGMGMNTGIQDAHNLIWKLATVERDGVPGSLLDTYESERRPIAQRNADQSLVNAMKMLEMTALLGTGDDPEAAHAAMQVMLADPAARARIVEAIHDQQDHFDMFGLQLGFSYENGALIPEGTAPPPPENPVRDYVPTARPGARLPHAWVEAGGKRVSVLDLLTYDGFTLVTGKDGSAWRDAARSLRPSLRCLAGGHDFRDSDGSWARLCEIESDGAVLVRPDQHVAWRSRSGVGDPRTHLERALGGLPL